MLQNHCIKSLQYIQNKMQSVADQISCNYGNHCIDCVPNFDPFVFVFILSAARCVAEEFIG